MVRRLPLVLAAALLAGCGGGDGLSKEDYVSQAEAICQSANDELNAMDVPTTPEEFQSFFNDGLSLVEDATQQLMDLEAPSADAEELQRALTGPLTTQAGVLRDFAPDVQEAVESDDPEAAFRALDNPTENASEDAEADGEFLDSYGLPQCSQLAS